MTKMLQFMSLLFISVALAQFSPLPGWRLIQLESKAPPVWMSPSTVRDLTTQDANWMDITDFQHFTDHPLETLGENMGFNYPSEVTHRQEVAECIGRANINNVIRDLTTFSSFQNRYYTSPFGLESADWIFTTVKLMIEQSGRHDLSVGKTFHANIPQPNVVARIEGTSGSDDILIMGAHQDSVNNVGDRNTNRAPGAADDGTGSMVILELLRQMIFSGFQPERSIEVHWYAAEEVGLLGSQALANQYRADDRSVFAMLQFDVHGWAPNGLNAVSMGLVAVDTDPALYVFIGMLIDEYLRVPYHRSGGAGSDHRSWFRAGYPSAFAREGTSPPYYLNPYKHSENDVMDVLDFEYVFEWLKLGCGFVCELQNAP